jgi:hypothetical protein
MRRIIYVPWPKSACPVTAKDVEEWADSYGKRTHKASKTSKTRPRI